MQEYNNSTSLTQEVYRDIQEQILNHSVWKIFLHISNQETIFLIFIFQYFVLIALKSSLDDGK